MTGDLFDDFMEEVPVQLLHGWTVLEEPLEAEGLIFLRSDGIQLLRGKPEGHGPDRALIYRRGTQEGVQLLALGLDCRGHFRFCLGTLDAFWVLAEPVQEPQDLPLHVVRRGAAAELPQLLLGWSLLRRSGPLRPLGPGLFQNFLLEEGRVASSAGVSGILQDTGHHVLVPGLVRQVGDTLLSQGLHQGGIGGPSQVLSEDPPHRLGLDWVGDNRSQLHPVAEGLPSVHLPCRPGTALSPA